MVQARVNLDELFPPPTSPPTADQELRLGYEDFSDDNQATELLRTLPPGSAELLHKFSYLGLHVPLELIEWSIGLIGVFDQHNRDRRGTQPDRLVQAELDSVSRYLGLIATNDYLPTIGIPMEDFELDEDDPYDDYSPDAQRHGWFTFRAALMFDEDSRQANFGKVQDDLAVLRRYAASPAIYREEYQTVVDIVAMCSGGFDVVEVDKDPRTGALTIRLAAGTEHYLEIS